RRLGVDRRKGLQISFRMAGRDTADAAGSGTRPGAVAGNQPLRLSERRKPQVVRIGLRPFEAAPGTVDADLQAVFVAGRHLAAPEHALGATVKAQHDMGIVIEPAALDEAVEIGSKTF